MGVRVAARQCEGVWQPAAVKRHQQQLVLYHVLFVSRASFVAVARGPSIKRLQSTSNKHKHETCFVLPTLTGYNGHTFWDCESWMFPPLLTLQPRTALQLLQCVPIPLLLMLITTHASTSRVIQRVAHAISHHISIHFAQVSLRPFGRRHVSRPSDNPLLQAHFLHI